MISAANRLQPLNGNNHLTEITMKKIFFVFAISLNTLFSFGQSTDSVKQYRVGIFASLYFDSSFTGTNYRFANQMPKYILPGFDFVQGALMAVDSLNSAKTIKVIVYDLRSAGQSLLQLSKQNTFDSLDLMIGAVTGTEYRQLADLALLKNIPFVSATYPNDGGITNNPFTIIVNPTLPTQCEAIYRFIQRNNPLANIVYARKSGQQDDRLAGYFNKYNQGTNGSQLLKWKTVLLTDTFSAANLRNSLDSEKTNLIICGSLDEGFGTRLITTAHTLSKNFPIELMGMPTWEGLKDLNKPELNELVIYYSSTFFNTGTVKWTNFSKTFTDATNGRPSDLAYRGYELSWHFINLLLKYDRNMMQNLNDKSFRSFTEFDFKPIFNSTNGKPDYFENKRIYMLKRSSGLISRMN